jgi:hypothetical protein
LIELSPSLPSVDQPAKKEGASQLEKLLYSELLLSRRMAKKSNEISPLFHMNRGCTIVLVVYHQRCVMLLPQLGSPLASRIAIINKA